VVECAYEKTVVFAHSPAIGMAHRSPSLLEHLVGMKEAQNERSCYPRQSSGNSFVFNEFWTAGISRRGTQPKVAPGNRMSIQRKACGAAMTREPLPNSIHALEG
jgi:hypothetical protein